MRWSSPSSFCSSDRAGAVRPSLPRIAAAALTVAAAAPAAALAQGMPQLDFSTPLTTSQVVWGAIIFVLLWVLLQRWALPEVRGVLEHRAAAIEADLEAARGAKARADAAAAEMSETVARARAEAQTAITAAVDQAKQEAAQQSAALNSRLEAQLHAAELSIGEARAAAMGALRQVATDTAATVVLRLTGRAADAETMAGAVGQAMAARRT